jgi:hypothetical protein
MPHRDDIELNLYRCVISMLYMPYRFETNGEIIYRCYYHFYSILILLERYQTKLWWFYSHFKKCFLFAAWSIPLLRNYQYQIITCSFTIRKQKTHLITILVPVPWDRTKYLWFSTLFNHQFLFSAWCTYDAILVAYFAKFPEIKSNFDCCTTWFG